MAPDERDPQRLEANSRTTWRQWRIVAVLTPAVAVGWVLVMPSAPVAQPAAFNHAHHRALACMACHRGVESQARATLPTGAVCAKCHATAPAGISDTQWKAFASPRGTWQRVTSLPMVRLMG